MLVSSLYCVSGLLPLQPINCVVRQLHQASLLEQLVGINFNLVEDRMFCSPVTDGYRSVSGVVGSHAPLVVVRGQRDLGDALRGNLVPSGSQGVKPRPVRHAVEKAIFVIFKGYTVFYHGLFHTLTLLVGLPVVHLVGIQLGSQPNKLGYGLARSLILHHPQYLFVRASDGVSLRVVAGVEPFGNVLRYILVKVLRLDPVKEGVRVRKKWTSDLQYNTV